MSTLTAIQKTIEDQKKSHAVKLTPNSADTSLIASREEGVLIEGSNATVKNSPNAGGVTIKGGDPNRDSVLGGRVTLQGGHQTLSQSTSQAGDVNILGGDGYKGGNILIVGGDNTDNSASSITGAIAIQTGGQDLTSDQHTGNILINTGNVSAVKSSGSLDIKTGTPHNAVGSSSGGVTIETGGTASTANAGTSGGLVMKTGQGGVGGSGAISYSTGNTSSGNTGAITFQSGTSSTGITGGLSLFSGGAGDGGVSGGINIVSGGITKTLTPAYPSGDVSISSGAGVGAWANSGTLTLNTGDSARETGNASISSGASSGTGTTGTLTLKSGDNTGASDSGTVTLSAGSVDSTLGTTGILTIKGGDNNSTTGLSGLLKILGGDAPNRTGTNKAGGVLIAGGKANANTTFGSATYGGDIDIEAYGYGTIEYNAYVHSMTSHGGGGVQLKVTDPSYLNLFNGPDIILKANTPSNLDGWVGLVASHASAQSGDILLWNNDGGAIQLKTEQGNHTSSGDISISTGAGTNANITLTTEGGITLNSTTGTLDVNSDNLDVDVSNDIHIDASNDIHITSITDTFLETSSAPNSVGNDQRILTLGATGLLKSLGVKIIHVGKVTISTGVTAITDPTLTAPANSMSADTKIFWNIETSSTSDIDFLAYPHYVPANFTLGAGTNSAILYCGLVKASSMDVTINYVMYETF